MRFRGWLASFFSAEFGPRLVLGRYVSFYQPSRIHLGQDVYLAYGVVILANHDVCIEDDVMISPYAVVASGRHTRKSGSFRKGKVIARPIRIGRGTWVGTHASVLDGAVIGAGCILAENSCATAGKSPDNTLDAGVSARAVKEVHDDEP